MSDRVDITRGRLDGMCITPIVRDGELRFLDITVDTLPGLRLVLEADAARELATAITAVDRAVRGEPLEVDR